MSHATEIRDVSDSMIREYPPRERSRYIDYVIGANISVTWMGGDSYLCKTCQGIDRFQNAEHKGCAHIRRIVRYREEHSPDSAA